MSGSTEAGEADVGMAETARCGGAGTTVRQGPAQPLSGGSLVSPQQGFSGSPAGQVHKGGLGPAVSPAIRLKRRVSWKRMA